MIATDMIDFIDSDLRTFGISVFIFLILMLTVIFRRLRWILLPLTGCAAAVVLMMGTLALARWPVTVISSNFVSLLLIICMSMTIHLVVRFRELQAKEPGGNPRDLVARTVHFMFTPILYTALTTMVAFVSLLISGIRPVIDFGYMMTAGIAMALGVIFLLFPSVVALLPRTQGEERDFTRGVTLAFARLTERYRKPILGVAVVLAVVSAFGAARLDVENRFIDYFDEDTEIFQGMLEIDQHLGGTTPLDIILEADPEALVEEEEEFEEDFYGDLEGEAEESPPGYWFNPLRLGELRQLHEWLDAQPEIGKVLSLDTMIRMAESINDGEPLDDLKISLLREGLSRLPEDMQDVLLRPFLSEDGNRLRVSLRVIDSDVSLRRAELIERVDGFLSEEMGYDESRYRQSGLLVLVQQRPAEPVRLADPDHRLRVPEHPRHVPGAVPLVAPGPDRDHAEHAAGTAGARHDGLARHPAGPDDHHHRRDQRRYRGGQHDSLHHPVPPGISGGPGLPGDHVALPRQHRAGDVTTPR